VNAECVRTPSEESVTAQVLHGSWREAFRQLRTTESEEAI